jgi:F420-0:gamma-glutamyl ligase
MHKPITIQAIETRLFGKGESLEAFLREHLQGYALENAILAVTSKLISVAEQRYVAKGSISKDALVRQEADQYLGAGGSKVPLTIKHGLLIPFAGIDESNSETGEYLLFPEDPYKSVSKISVALKAAFGLKNFGVILTDSWPMPLRKGVIGVGLSHWGFRANKTFVGQPDLFGRPLDMTSVDVLDALAGMAVFAMGEAAERKPLAVIQGADVEFTESSSINEIAIDPDLDLYAPLLKRAIES